MPQKIGPREAALRAQREAGAEVTRAAKPTASVVSAVRKKIDQQTVQPLGYVPHPKSEWADVAAEAGAPGGRKKKRRAKRKVKK